MRTIKDPAWTRMKNFYKRHEDGINVGCLIFTAAAVPVIAWTEYQIRHGMHIGGVYAKQLDDENVSIIVQLKNGAISTWEGKPEASTNEE